MFWDTLPPILCSIINLKLNMQKLFSLRSYGPSWNWLLMIAFWELHLFLHLHHQAVTGWCFGAASLTLLQKESVVTAYCTVWGPTHSMPRDKFRDYCTEKAHRKYVCNSSALWILPSSLGRTSKYFQIFTAENTFCSCAHTYLIELCLCLL